LAAGARSWRLNGRGGGAAGVVARGRDGLDFGAGNVIFLAGSGVEITTVACVNLSISGRRNFKRAEGNKGERSLPLLDCDVGSR